MRSTPVRVSVARLSAEGTPEGLGVALHARQPKREVTGWNGWVSGALQLCPSHDVTERGITPRPSQRRVDVGAKGVGEVFVEAIHHA